MVYKEGNVSVFVLDIMWIIFENFKRKVSVRCEEVDCLIQSETKLGKGAPLTPP